MYFAGITALQPWLPEGNKLGSEPELVIFQKKVAGLSSSSLERFALRARRAAQLPGLVNVLVASSAELKSLNRKFRGADKPTDVLSFPSLPAKRNQARRVAGEIAISLEIARENAGRFRHSVAEEIKILTLHGILHLAGFDHERDNGEMARKESRLRRELNLEGSLIERGQPHDFKFVTRDQRGGGSRVRSSVTKRRTA